MFSKAHKQQPVVIAIGCGHKRHVAVENPTEVLLELAHTIDQCPGINVVTPTEIQKLMLRLNVDWNKTTIGRL